MHIMNFRELKEFEKLSDEGKEFLLDLEKLLENKTLEQQKILLGMILLKLKEEYKEEEKVMV